MSSAVNTIAISALRRALGAAFVAPKALAAWYHRSTGRTNGIEQVLQGSLRHPGNTYAIFVIWPGEHISWSVLNALAALEATGVSVILASNAPLSEASRSTLLAKCHTLILRDNSGHDFGAYRDATLFCLETLDFERLLYLNDSVFYFSAGLKALFDRLAHTKAGACAAFESHEHHPHLQSFCFSVSGTLARHPGFQSFWSTYLPVNSRLWAIHQGELRLSRVIYSLTQDIEFLFTPKALRSHLTGLPLEDLRRLQNLLPRQLRAEPDPGQTGVDDLLTQVATRSPIHSGGFLFQKYLGSPLMKRDLVYRLLFTPEEVEQSLRDLGETEHLQEILDELRRRGTGEHLPLVKRLAIIAGER